METRTFQLLDEKSEGDHYSREALPISSRICVKNIPKHVDETRLREHFSLKGRVTDAKIMRTRDGKSRLFGFVGFSTADEAEAAVGYFNKSFLDTSRLVVEFAFKYGNAEVPRAWSKYTPGTSANRMAAQAGSGANTVPLKKPSAEGGEADMKKRNKKKPAVPKPEEEDPKLAEFLQLMQPRSKQAIWSNEDPLLQAAAAGAGRRGGQGKEGAAGRGSDAEGGSGRDLERLALEDGDESEGEEYQELPGGGSSEADVDVDSDAGESSDSEGQPDAVVQNAAVSDLDYLRSRMRANFDDGEDETELQGGEAVEGTSQSSLASDSEQDAEEEQVTQASRQGPGGSQEVQEQHQPQPQRPGRLKSRKDPAGDDVDAELDAIFGGGGAPEPPERGASSEEEGSLGDSPGAEGSPTAEEEENSAQGMEVVGGGDGEDSIGDTGRLFVRNLPYTATEADLRQLFEGYGEVQEAHLVLDRVTKKSKGFALVQFTSPQDAVAAHEQLDGSIFMGRLLHVLPGKRPPPPPAEAEGEGEDGGKKGGGFKEQKEARLKASAGNRAAWNTLFMRSDTVAEAVAAHYGVSKAELLDREAADMAVRMALGETHVIAETKRQLGDAGASVDVLEAAAAAVGRASQRSSVPRSDTVLLVKNLPYSASQEELEGLFGGVGPLGRLVLPSTKTLALVEFLEPQDARKAFKALAYKRYQHVPLYLEWAPKGLFSAPPPPQGLKAQPAPKGTASKPAPSAKAGGEAAAAAALATTADDADSDSFTIFVKNLAWATEDAGLREHFLGAAKSAGGKLRAAKVARRKGPDGKMLSAGYGFVECSSEEVAKEVIKKLQGTVLDGHKLALQLSTAKVGAKKKEKLPDTAKMVVRNVAFEATRRDIMGLFTPFGHVKDCRLPRKFDGTHRGFAFVEFATKQEARNAMDAVAGAHLYGRRLVLEWAEEEGGLDELRAKTAAKYRGNDGGGVEHMGAERVRKLAVVEDRPAKKQKKKQM